MPDLGDGLVTAMMGTIVGFVLLAISDDFGSPDDILCWVPFETLVLVAAGLGFLYIAFARKSRSDNEDKKK